MSTNNEYIIPFLTSMACIALIAFFIWFALYALSMSPAARAARGNDFACPAGVLIASGGGRSEERPDGTAKRRYYWIECEE